jgi:hypothetical protein
LFWNPQARFNLIWGPYHFFLSFYGNSQTVYLEFFFIFLPSTSSYYATITSSSSTILFIKFIFKPERFLWIQVTTFYVRSQQHQLLKNHHHKKNLLHLLYESNKGKMKIEIILPVTTVPESKATCQLLYYQNLVF